MYLETISITNFRLFENLNLILNPGLNILVGQNDSGKTALIDAIRYVLGVRSSERCYISESDFRKKETKFTIQLKFIDVDQHAYRFVEHLTHEIYTNEEGKEKSRPVLYVSLTAEKTGTERRGYPYIKANIRTGKDGSGLMLESDIRDFLAATYLKPLRDASGELSSGRGSRLSQILCSSKEINCKADEILSIVSKANSSLLDEGQPLKKSATDIQNNYLYEIIFNDDRDKLGVFIDIAGIKAENFDAMPEDEKKRHLRSVLERLSLALSEGQMQHGLGYNNLLFIAAELLLLEREVSNEYPLLLIEEPEAHIHPQLQMKLLQFINEKVKSDKKPDGIQCILSTHSPNLSSKASTSNVIVMNSGGAWSLRPGETEATPDDYKHMQKFLDATKANIFFAKSLMLVEGDGENILLPHLARLLGKPLEDYGVSIVKCDNSGSWKRFARLFLRKDNPHNPLPIKVSVLRDLDLWPNCAEDVEGNEYGFKDYKKKNGRKKGNEEYWLRNCDEGIDKRIESLRDDLHRQNVNVQISNDWTLEYCLAKHGLFEECYEALNGSKDDIGSIIGSDDEKATYIQSKVEKTAFPYKLIEILERQKVDYINSKISQEAQDVEARRQSAEQEFSTQLENRLPSYIVDSIKHVTNSTNTVYSEESGDGLPF